MSTEILKIENLKTHFPIRGGIFSHVVAHLKAVDGISLTVQKGETLGVVGESGCGKSTLGRTILRLYNPTGGTIVFQGQNITTASRPALRPLRRHMQMIFQDPFSSLNPRMTIERIICEPFRLHRVYDTSQQRNEAIQLLQVVGLRDDCLKKYPHELSGGQRQRVGIARAIALKPQLIIADEPIAALDVSIQSQILNLLRELKQSLQLTYLFISHDLSVVRYVSDRVAVMYLGKIVELTDASHIYENPKHPYTQALMSAIPQPDPTQTVKHETLPGDVPSAVNPPSGCAFHPRCRYAQHICTTQTPQLRNIASKTKKHWVSCHLAEEIDRDREKS